MISNENIRVYNKIMKIKKNKKLTFKELSKKADVPLSTFTSAVYYLKKGHSITLKSVRMIEKAFGMSIFFKD